MLKIRVQGLPDEVREFGDALERAGLVLERSGQYANRGASRYVREYMDVEAPREAQEIGTGEPLAIEGQGVEHA